MDSIKLERGSKGAYRYNYKAHNPKTNREYQASYGPMDNGPRGGCSNFCWQVLEYYWIEPDPWNEKGHFEFLNDYYLKTLQDVEKFLNGGFPQLKDVNCF